MQCNEPPPGVPVFPGFAFAQSSSVIMQRSFSCLEIDPLVQNDQKMTPSFLAREIEHKRIPKSEANDSERPSRSASAANDFGFTVVRWEEDTAMPNDEVDDEQKSSSTRNCEAGLMRTVATRSTGLLISENSEYSRPPPARFMRTRGRKQKLSAATDAPHDVAASRELRNRAVGLLLTEENGILQGGMPPPKCFRRVRGRGQPTSRA
eukprot:1647164-Rhodomonas_salina.1